MRELYGIEVSPDLPCSTTRLTSATRKRLADGAEAEADATIAEVTMERVRPVLTIA